ncbi:ABC transporter ATP-binding protein [Xylella fastidiosa subsp. morus]|jgi:lipopolysaccharide transport system ATP-binding protein|uniref:ABC transporter ATP-binding protein n=4 Tax=Xylella fastidiosa TaxID=2371 RepID=Q87A79_XYLFT|nr:ABC transporter ATP-binding protein [Xylella fastidiosa]ADN62817.1 ABC transporter related protein [Xylella fastidiosa subsp. fastidiosa GB514]ERI59586.1 sugar ABC transporter ATP-binding protein [Xylella fastidiosa subsp. multiplex Griffin-1]KAF0571615.1 sugar ABC transporter ATP-binding protein [Xylella fastidiosa subsp. fastidiosa Mus-1]AAO29780.1 ABC transporter ATP-binding protein [Xylella fastidiosa Temecula1]ACA12997.1 ABC transporter ATP-binding protein [Xylella fastidiosa M12]
MALIKFENVCVDFPIYNASSRSLKKQLIQAVTGGQLRKEESGRVVVSVLKELTFTLQDGARVGLLGHNGAGKSTLLRLLNNVYFPSSGQALIEGTTGSLIDISLGTDPEATGRENIYLRGALLGMTKSEINRSVNEIIEFSELGNFIDMPLRTYSTGMHLRLAFSVSTIVCPEILLMDEWLSVGDEGFKQKAEKRLSELVQATNILVVASHSKQLILNTCNRVIWLEHGQIRMDGDAQEVCTAYFG